MPNDLQAELRSGLVGGLRSLSGVITALVAGHKSLSFLHPSFQEQHAKHNFSQALNKSSQDLTRCLQRFQVSRSSQSDVLQRILRFLRFLDNLPKISKTPRHPT